MTQLSSSPMENKGIARLFTGLFALTQVMALGLLICLFLYIFKDSGGVGFSADKIFHWHPLLAVFGLVFLQGESILIYRAFRNVRKPVTKWIHAAIHFGALTCAIFTLVIIFRGGFRLANIHGYAGFTAVLLFALQYVVGFGVFLLPGAKPHIRAIAMPLHVFLGMAVFCLSCAVVLIGITKELAWAKDPNVASHLNLLGVFVVAFAFCVGFVGTSAMFKRVPLPEELPPLPN